MSLDCDMLDVLEEAFAFESGASGKLASLGLGLLASHRPAPDPL